MTPGAHLLSSWILAENFAASHRQRRIVSIIGLLPDIDGLGVVADLISGNRTEYYAIYHHLLCHNLLFGLLVSALAALFSRVHKLQVFVLSLCACHLHLLCDLVGSKGPDGDLWPLYYFFPFASNIELAWWGQWLLNGWQNLSILFFLFVWAVYYAVNHHRSFIEVISQRLDQAIFLAVKKRWPA